MTLMFAIGILVGALGGWLIAKYRMLSQQGISREELEQRYIQKEMYQEMKLNNQELQSEMAILKDRKARLESENSHIEERLAEERREIRNMEETLRTAFENLANKLLEEKSKKFLDLNEQQMGSLLNPLKEKIMAFEKRISDTQLEDTRERMSLKKELEQIVKLNQQVSDDANRLTHALKGDSKIQGNWGEVQLELILERAGLEAEIHYRKQASMKDEAGKVFRPDYIINLPDKKNLILDAKVSLTAYENCFNAEDDHKKALHLKEHISSISRHISELGSKNYPSLYGINPPDYVLMFVPVEPALTLALKEDPRLFEKALEKNIVLVSVSTLLATLRTISFIWKQENQKRNVYEIARESGKLYDKFVGFVEDLTGVGKKIDDARGAYGDAMKKLTESTRKGDTIVGRIERIRSLGADATRALPVQLLDQVSDAFLNDQENHPHDSLPPEIL